LQLAAEEQDSIEVSLPPQYGVVFVKSRPADASLFVDGKPSGNATRRLRLTTRTHSLESTVGNFADASIADTFANTVPDYNDGYRGTAPVGSFPAWPNGYHDLGGNVAEWTNDFYAVYPGVAEQLVTDPVGPASGEHYVVRGSSWRQGSIAELRLSFRDYSRVARPDLGFRIARYAE